MIGKRLSIRVDDELHKALRYIALEDETSLQAMFVEAIEGKYLIRILEKKMKGNSNDFIKD